MRLILILFAGITFGCSTKAKVKTEEVVKADYCESSKEFIVVHEFLKAQTYYDLEWAKAVSERASKGCKGSAKRFVKTMNLLTKVGVFTQDGASEAIRLANSTDEHANAYSQVFQKAYLEKYLDLDIQSSMQLARELTYDFDGDVKFAQKDFGKFVQFCGSAQQLGLSLPTCAQFSLKMTRYGEGKGMEVFPSFKKAFDFVSSKEGSNQPTHVALSVSESLIKAHPKAVDDYITAYKYAIKKKGLGLPVDQAMQLAKKLGLEHSRMPASIKSSSKK